MINDKREALSEFVTVAKTSEIEEGKVKVVRVGDAPVGVTLIEGEYFAFADVCTHDDGPVAEGELDEHTIECPRHGARFDVRTGRALSLPAVVPIPVYAVKVDGEMIKVSKKPVSST
jgi:3-phenylpropionate/trans-cinnamate dioxygenase ferredoxin subunit